MPNPWFRLYSEFSHDPKVQMMSEAMQRRYIMVMCLRCCNALETLHETEVAFHLRITEAELAETKALFVSKGFIDDQWNLLNWEKRQFKSDSSTERVSRHRANKKEVSNDDVTLQKRQGNALDTDTDTDTENTNTSLSPPAVPKADPVPVNQIVNLYHETLPKLPRVLMLTKKRRGQIEARWKSGVLPDLDTWKDFFTHVGNSKFLMGGVDPPPGKKRFVADLEWITNESNFTKIWEGKYHGQQGQIQRTNVV